MCFKERLKILALSLLVFQVLYSGTQKLVMHFGELSDVNLLLPFEQNIPFLPFFILIYMLAYVLPVWLFLSIKKRGRLYKTIFVFAVAIFIHLFFFISMPVEYHLRPHLSLHSHFITDLIVMVHTLDAPINTFPSLHVSSAFICYFLMRRYRPQWGTVMLVLAVAIAVSTVVVKQHFILDVVAGGLVAVMLNHYIIQRDLAEVFRRFNR